MLYKGRRIVCNKSYNFGLFDLIDGQLSKVNRMFGQLMGKDTLRFSRLPYSKDGMEYHDATVAELEMFQCSYFEDDGTRPFKEKDCTFCEKRETCFMKDSDLERYKKNGEGML